MTQLTVKSLFALVLSFHNLTLCLPLYALVQTLKLGEIRVTPGPSGWPQAVISF